MKIDHIAIWTDDIETMRDFYLTYFDVTCGNKYVNPIKNFTSYFLSFGDGNARIEQMATPLPENPVHRATDIMKAPFSTLKVIISSFWENNGLYRQHHHDFYVLEPESNQTIKYFT